MRFKRTTPVVAWLLCFGLILLWFFRLAWQGLVIDTSLLSLLPQTEQDPVRAQLIDQVTESISAKVLVLIGHADRDQARRTAQAFAAEMEKSTFFEKVQVEHGDTSRAFYELYFPYRYQLLSENTQLALQKPGAGAWLVQKNMGQLYSPSSSAYSLILEKDPLLLFPDFLQGLPKPPGDLQLDEGLLSTQKDGITYVFLSADTTHQAFSREGQKQTGAFLETQSRLFRTQTPGLQLFSTGLIRYTAAGANQAETEVSTIGLGSMLGIVLVFLLAFRSVRPLLLSFLPILAGLLCAVVACLAVFGRIHLITIGFGASMIGMCIDYTFHFYCECAESHDRERVLSKIFPALLLGVLTSIVGYAGLLLAPFPGLQQMALFSAVGLFAAFATVVLLFPVLCSSHLRLDPSLLRMSAGYLSQLRRIKGRSLVLSLVPVSLLCAGMLRLTTNDDVRSLQLPSPQLQTEEAAVRRIVGGVDTSRFILVEGPSVEEVLQRQETLGQRLGGLVKSGALTWYQTVSGVLPSEAAQARNHQSLQKALLGPDQALEGYLQELAFEPEVGEAVRQALASAPKDKLTLGQWLNSPASASFRHLWLGETPRGYAALILLGGIKDAEAIQSACATGQGAAYIDKVTDISDLLQRNRSHASWLVACSYLAIILALFFRYGWKGGFGAVIPPMLATATTLGIFGWLGIPINLFHILAMLLVLGIGIDYAIFFAERGGHHPTTMLAVCLSALTTILSFGLLALSTTPVLRSFGLFIWLGITFSWLFSPFSVKRSATGDSESHDKSETV